MAQQRLGIIMNGVTGRMGMNQHLIRSIVAIRAQGGVALRNGDTRDARSDPGRPQRGEARAAGQGARHDALDHRPRCRAQEPRRTRCSSMPPRPSCAPSCCTRRSRPARTSIARSRSPRPSRMRVDRGARRQEGRHQARRGAGQAVPARPAQAQDADRLRLLRPHPLGARRVRLLGVRGRLAAGAAPVLELPQEGRRRHHPRHALPLALRARQPVRRGRERLLPRRHPHPQALGRERQAVQGRRRRRRLCHLPARGRRHRPHQHAPGARACAATISSPSMSTARWARRWPACRNAGARRG